MKKYDIILFLGQSNMQGQTEKLSETEEVENALEYRLLSDSLIPLKNPVGEDILYNMSEGYNFEYDTDWQKWFNEHVICSAACHHTNIVPEFVRSYIKASGHNVIAVHAAKGATTSEMWAPGSKGCDAILTKAKAAINKVGKENVGTVSAVWLQGESDALANVSEETYMINVTALKDILKAELGLKKFGIIKVGRFGKEQYKGHDCEAEYFRRDEVIRNAQVKLCKAEDFVMLADITDKMFYPYSPYANPFAVGHYSAMGLELLGRLSGEMLFEAIEK